MTNDGWAWRMVMNNSDKWVTGTAIVVVTFALLVLTWAADWSLKPATDMIAVITGIVTIQYTIHKLTETN